jgi:hypothetical protein
MELSGMQRNLFEPALFVLRPALLGPHGAAPFFLIGCGRHKRVEPTIASDLYLSDRFRSSKNLAHLLAAPYAILSGMHGIVAAETLLLPYDLNLADLAGTDQRRWARDALDALRDCAEGRTVTLLAAPEYTAPLTEVNEVSAAPLDLVVPWARLAPADFSVWLVEATRMATRIHDLDLLYSWIDGQRREGRVFAFRNLAEQPVPKRGVYLFLDPREPNFRGVNSRIVRIGTHAVSSGSKATLRARLRNHLGPASEIGNHRGSIFRLHIGRAMLEAREGHASLPSWGQGQDARPEVRALEVKRELAVSRYLQDLEVVLIDVDDEPGKDSLRAKVEAQLIALCSEAMQPIDSPTTNWLGLNSAISQIRQSGLWNIRGVGGTYDPIGPGSVGLITKT